MKADVVRSPLTGRQIKGPIHALVDKHEPGVFRRACGGTGGFVATSAAIVSCKKCKAAIGKASA